MDRRHFILLGCGLGCAVLLSGRGQAQAPHAHQHSFSGAQQWAEVFDDPKRDEWQKPHEVLKALQLAPDATVADIGAGTGYFAVRLAHMVPKGRVYAVDVEPDMVKHLAQRAKQTGLRNLVAVQGATDTPKLPRKVDLALFVDVYHHIGDRARYFRNLAGALAPRGRIAVIDFRRDSPEGPPPDARIPPDDVKAELERAGYVLRAEHTFLPFQYFLVFERRRT